MWVILFLVARSFGRVGIDHIFHQNNHIDIKLHTPVYSDAHIHIYRPGNTQWLIQLKAPVTSLAQRIVQSHLAKLNSTLGQYIPNNAYIVIGPDTSTFHQHLRETPFVVLVTKFHPKQKLRQDYSVSGNEVPTRFVGHIPAEMFNSTKELSEVAARWQTQVNSLLPVGGKVSIEALTNHRVELVFSGVAPDEVQQALTTLAEAPELHWVEPVPKMVPQNKYARLVIQSDWNTTSIWNRGLHGEDQVILVSDTGLDYDSCYFWDANQTLPVSRTQINMNHRKVVAYVPLADNKDDVAGHGSHVSGSVAGEVQTGDPTLQTQLAQYNGMAYRSKIIFYDLKKSNTDDLSVPLTLYDDVFKDGYVRAGARVMTNSWGSAASDYGHYAQEADRFAHDYRDSLVVFAAGNYGEKGHHSLSTPGVAKNVLTIGATKSSIASFYEQGQETGFEIISPNELSGKYPCTPADFGPRLADIPKFSATVVIADPILACGTLNNAAAVKGKVLVVQRGTCLFTVKAKLAADLKAAMLIVVHDTAGPPIIMGGDMPADFPIPSAMVSQAIGQKLIQSSKLIAISAPVAYESLDQSEAVLAEFSSRGPTLDGRMKPDICAPGMFVVSVRSDGDPTSFTCSSQGSLISMQGTSMAAPIAAGAAVLARQYFLEGWYTGGFRGSGPSINPSGALLKAVIINSAVAVGGVVEVEDGEEAGIYYIQPPPSHDQGFGRLELETALYFNDSNFQFFVSDDQTLNSLEVHTFCFQVNAAGSPASPFAHKGSMHPLRATLTWMDPPASPSAAVLLVNDLDLFLVNMQTKQVLVGNEKMFTDQDGEHLSFDTLNTVEQVHLEPEDVNLTLEDPQARIFALYVRGTNVPVASQAYALAVTGNFKMLPNSACAGGIACPNDCNSESGSGKCGTAGICECNAPYGGADCSQLSRPLSGIVQGTVKSEAWEYYHFSVSTTDLNSGLVLSLSRTSKVGDPDVYIQYENFPTLHSYKFYSTQCDTCTNGRNMAGSTPSKVTMAGSELRVGTYRVGVHGYCCEDTSFELKIEPGTRPLFWYWFLFCSVIGICLFLVLRTCYQRYRLRRLYSNSPARFMPLRAVVGVSDVDARERDQSQPMIRDVTEATAIPVAIESTHPPTLHAHPLNQSAPLGSTEHATQRAS